MPMAWPGTGMGVGSGLQPQVTPGLCVFRLVESDKQGVVVICVCTAGVPSRTSGQWQSGKVETLTLYVVRSGSLLQTQVCPYRPLSMSRPPFIFHQDPSLQAVTCA